MDHADALREALLNVLAVARGFQHQQHGWFDLQVQADVMAEAIEIYDRIAGTDDPIEAEAALASIALDEIIDRELDKDD